jgi:tetratricopeptide (TPR) repeat protein
MFSGALRVTLCAILVSLWASGARAQEPSGEASTLAAWKETAKKTAVGNQLIQILNSSNAILKGSPKHKQALYLRGYLFGTVGCTSSAIADLTKAIEADPSFAAAYTERGICYMDQKNYTRAKLDLDKAIQLCPRSGDAHFARGKLFLEMDRPTSALSDLASCQAMSFAPALPGELPANYYNAPSYYLGACYEAMGRPDTALRYYKDSVKSPRLGGSGYIHRYSDQPLDASHRVALYEGR